ncbi:preprotein translocase subunit SecY, partial [Shouchella clausii]
SGGMLIENPGIGTYLLIAIVLTAGTAFLLWLGEQITSKGVGNGISIIIFAGIVAGIPSTINQIYAQQFEDAGDQLFIRIVTVVILLLAILAVVVGVIFIQQALRKIPIQ